MIRPQIVLAAVSLCAVTALVQAQPRAVSPGLWESKVQNPEMDAALAQMQAELAKMPPAQRAQMEKMMGQQGVAMGPGNATRFCLSPEMAKSDPAASAAREGCKHNVTWAGNVAKMDYSCQSGEKGRGEFTYVSDKAYNGWMENAGKGGKPMKMTVEAKWVAADCGTLKPIKRP